MSFNLFPWLRVLPITGRGLPLAGDSSPTRADQALTLRTRAAEAQSARPAMHTMTSGDEAALPGRIGCYSKSLPKNKYGEVDRAAYDALVAACETGKFSDFERIPRAGGRKLSNPQSAFAFSLEGGDSHTFSIRSAPSLSSPLICPDADELYWQALCRDIPFSEYGTSPTIREAATHMGVSPLNVFRGYAQGDLAGPYISQFLIKPIPYGSGHIEQKFNTPESGSDFMTSFNEWSQIQQGFDPWRSARYRDQPRYISSGRDLAEYVHYDFAYQAYLGAALILINANAKSIHNCNQFKSANNPYRYSTREDGFATFGPAEAVDWLGRVTTAALKAAYCHKWMVHRRLRPEELGGLIELTKSGRKSYPLHDSLLQSRAIEEVAKTTGTFLLPQAYPEGCPTHPSYPAGHAAVAGACSVILKACFDGNMLLPNCLEPTADGSKLNSCSDYFPTVNDEINKLAANVSMGRNWAGIHFRSDNVAGLQLGEAVGISILQDLAQTFTEDIQGFSLRLFAGNRINIGRDGTISV